MSKNSAPEESMKDFFKELEQDPDHPVYEELFRIGEMIANRIRHLRKQKGLTQADLARKMRRKQNQISQLEDPTYCGYTLETLVRVAQALECSFMDLVQYCSSCKNTGVVERPYMAGMMAHNYCDCAFGKAASRD